MSFIILLYIILKFYVFNYNEIKIRKNIKINLFKFQKTKNSILHFKKKNLKNFRDFSSFEQCIRKI
jgi:hypothetical protein